MNKVSNTLLTINTYINMLECYIEELEINYAELESELGRYKDPEVKHNLVTKFGMKL